MDPGCAFESDCFRRIACELGIKHARDEFCHRAVHGASPVELLSGHLEGLAASPSDSAPSERDKPHDCIRQARCPGLSLLLQSWPEVHCWQAATSERHLVRPRACVSSPDCSSIAHERSAITG